MDLPSSFPPSRDHFYIIYNVNERKRVGRDWVFLGLLLGISLGRPHLGPPALGGAPALGKSLGAALGKTQSLPPLFLSLIQ